MVRKYFIVDGDEKQGPYTVNELKNLDITPQTLVWSEGMDDWTQAVHIVDLKHLFTEIPQVPVQNEEGVVSTGINDININEKVAKKLVQSPFQKLSSSKHLSKIIYVILTIFGLFHFDGYFPAVLGASVGFVFGAYFPYWVTVLIISILRSYKSKNRFIWVRNNKLLLIPIILFLIALKGDYNRSGNGNNTSADYDELRQLIDEDIFTDEICENMSYFGTTPICLPSLDGMIECYSNPRVKAFAEIGRFGDNQILGFYLNDDTHRKVAELGTFDFDDYFKLYGAAELKDLEVDDSMLDEILSLMNQNYTKIDWEEVISEIEESLNTISWDTPILIETFVPDKEIRSSLFLMKMQTLFGERIMIMTMNAVVIKGKIIFYSYYMDYEDEKSIRRAKAKNNYFGLKLLEKKDVFRSKKLEFNNAKPE